MNFALILKTVVTFMKKHWKVIAFILGVFIVSGMARRMFGTIGMWWSLRNSKADPNKTDYDFLALSVHSAMYQGLFNMGENEGAIISLINTLGSQVQFLELCRKYALKYHKDLREELLDHFNDTQYSKLLWK